MLTLSEKDALLIEQGQTNNNQIQQILDLKHKLKQSESIFRLCAKSTSWA
jgi:hypothetical protein